MAGTLERLRLKENFLDRLADVVRRVRRLEEQALKTTEDGRLRVEGLGVGVNAGVTGSVMAADDVRAAGGLTAGATPSPAAGQMLATGHIKTDGGLYAGDVNGTLGSGHIVATNDIRAGGGISAGNTADVAAPGEVLATLNMRTNTGITVGDSAQNGGTTTIGVIYLAQRVSGINTPTAGFAGLFLLDNAGSQELRIRFADGTTKVIATDV
jgi:hypothetical protein